MSYRPGAASPLQREVRVLIADDEPRARQALRALLDTTRLGVTGESPAPIQVVGEAADGAETLRQVAESHPDVVLIDARMPVMDGFETTRRIKHQWPGVRIVFLTMYGSRRGEALLAGADAFLLKGCRPQELMAAILGPQPAV